MHKSISHLLSRHVYLFLFLAISIALTFITVYLLKSPVLTPPRAAPEARLSLIPRNMAQSPEGRWQFTKDQEVTVDVVLESGNHEIETVETTLHYDSDVLTLLETDDSIRCSELTSFKEIAQDITMQDDTEAGSASISCSMVDTQNTQNYTPLPSHFAGRVVQYTFKVKQTTSDSQIDIHYTPASLRNDSNVLEFEGECCSTTDVLGGVENISFDAVAEKSVASLALSPSSTHVSHNEPFDVSINLSTGPHEVDAVDAILTYDATKLEAVSIKQSSLFDQYIKTPSDTGISEEGSEGIIDISGVIDPNSGNGIQGDNRLLATVTFKPIVNSGIAPVSFFIEGTGEKNDTNISEFTTGNDILKHTVPATYVITDSPITPTPSVLEPEIRLAPPQRVAPVGIPINIDVMISTAGEDIDSVDAIIVYDDTVFDFLDVSNSSLFDTYSVNHTGNQIEISGLINPETSEPISGNDLLFTTVSLTPKTATSQTDITLAFENTGSRNDSNMVAYKQAVDILKRVKNARYTLTDTPVSIVNSIRLKIALEGRGVPESPKNRDVNIRILNSFFDKKPLSAASDIHGEILVNNTHLQDRVPLGSYDFLIKPNGYLQRRINMPLIDQDNVIDITDSPFPAGDLDNSGKINVLDWRIYIDNFNTEDALPDIDGSGKVTVLDSVFLLSNWNKLDEN